MSKTLLTSEEDMDQAVKDAVNEFIINFAGKEQFPEETIRRSEAMLKALLHEADAPKGEYQFRIKGSYPPFEKLSGPHLEVDDGMVSIAMLIMIRARHGVDGSLSGSLYLPEGVNRAALLKDAKIAADAFNKNGDWVGVLHHLPPNPPPERFRTAPVLPPAPVPTAALPLNNQKPGARAQKEPDDEYSRFLKRLLQGKGDGIFTGKELSDEARKCFAGKPDRWYATGIASELLGRNHHWIRRIGNSRYQVEQSFLDKYPLLGLKLVPQPAMKRRQSIVDRPKKGRRAIRGSVGVLSLLEQRAEIDRQLDAERSRCETAVTAARESLAQAEAGVMAARELLAQKEAELAEVNKALGKS